MLSEARIEQILAHIPRLTIGVLGDLFLDRYLDIDASLTEPSIETELDAYQVVRVRSYPGAAGTVINNLVALGVGRVVPISVIGDDGEGYELRKALGRLRVVNDGWVRTCPGRHTPTYTKLMLSLPGQPPRELNRLDIKNRKPLPASAEQAVLSALDKASRRLDALLVLDQVSEMDCGVVTNRVRDRVGELGASHAVRLILTDSRERIGLFRHVTTKPNRQECLKAVNGGNIAEDLTDSVRRLSAWTERPVFCTLGDKGIDVLSSAEAERLIRVPAYPVNGPIDTVGAGDSTSAGIACALAGGASFTEAAAFGNLVASITIQQIGTTGTATPEQVRQRWREICQD